MDDMREVQIGSDLIYEGKILDFYRDTVRLPNGRSATRELVRHNGAVAIVPSQSSLASTRRQPASSLPRSGHWAPNLGPK